MSQVVQATCPGCQALLHIPTELLAQPVRCNACGVVLRMRPPESARPVSPALPTGPTPPPLPQPRRAEEDPTASPFDFDSGVGTPASTVRKRRRRQRSGNWVGVLASVVILGLTAGGVQYFYTSILVPRQQATLKGEEDQEPTGEPGKPGKAPAKSADPPAAPFPRRALLISVHNYLYANPIPPGQPDDANLDRLTESLHRALRVPADQIVHLSDAARKDPRPPFKSVVEQTLANFLKTTRKQDRVLVLFAGHTKEIDNKAYLVPLDGELDNAATLIPLDWVYQQLAGCDCRQKVFVLDGNRFNAAQGEERPRSGPMGPKFEAALKSPPEGVQVWSACAAGQMSREFEGSPLGLFLDSLQWTLSPEKGKKGALDGKIQKPDDLFPLQPIHDAVQERMTAVLERRKLDKQTAFLAGKPPASGAEYDRAEKQADRPALPTLQYGDRKLVKAILDEISLPPIKGGDATGLDVDLALLPPFAAASLKPYVGADLPADSKLRQAIHQARVALWAVSPSKTPADLLADVRTFREKKVKVDLSILRERYGRPGGGAAETAFKARVFEDSKLLAPIVGRLTDDVLYDLQEAGKEKDAAPKRWQANYQFLLARLQAQLAYLEEYQGLLGQMRRELPEHDKNLHSGFRMASREKAGDPVGKKLERALRKIYADLAKEYPGTPWEVLAKREKLTALGLEWKAY